MLQIMFRSPERGVLRKQNSSKYSSKDLAKVVATDEQTIVSLLAELEKNGVYSTTGDDLIYCRRMVREERLRQTRISAGRVGGMHSKGKAKRKQKYPPPSPSPSSSSSPSPSFTEETPPLPPPPPGGEPAPPETAPAGAGDDNISPAEFLTAWNSTIPWSRIYKMTAKRKVALRQRAADSVWRANWRKALTLVAESRFCQGENDRGWRANADWFLRPDTVIQQIERAENAGRTLAGQDEIAEYEVAAKETER